MYGHDAEKPRPSLQSTTVLCDTVYIHWASAIMHATSERLKGKSSICYRAQYKICCAFAQHHGLFCRAFSKKHILYDAVGKIGLAESSERR